jgi:hypothetical protein
MAALCLLTPLAIWLLFSGMRFDYAGGWSGVVGWEVGKVRLADAVSGGFAGGPGDAWRPKYGDSR